MKEKDFFLVGAMLTNVKYNYSYPSGNNGTCLKVKDYEQIFELICEDIHKEVVSVKTLILF